MSTCTYHEHGTRVCPATAAYAAVGHAGVWEAVAAPGPTRPHPEFCAAHAAAVAAARVQAAHAETQRRTLPAARCAVCDAGLPGVGITLPDVGAVCDACHRASQGELMEDPRTRAPRRRGRRPVEVVPTGEAL